MRYMKELKSVVLLCVPTFIGCIIGAVVIPYLFEKDNSYIATKIVGGFIGVFLIGIVTFIFKIKKRKNSKIE